MIVENESQSTGYGHRRYAESLSEFGSPFYLPGCRAWVIERKIVNTSLLDGVGCYPLFTCENWSELDGDLAAIGSRWVSMTLVAAPFGDYGPEQLKRTFPSLCVPFKEHYVIDLRQAREEYVDRNHRRNVRRGLREIEVHRCENSQDYLDDWVKLYDILKNRHRITGISAFSARSFVLQFQTPGLVVFRAAQQDRTVAMLLWYVQGNIGYYHLGASSDVGYATRALFALFWKAIEYFGNEGLAALDLGGVAGLSNIDDGLRRFKAGWSTGVRFAYLCGRIMDEKRYIELAGNQHHFEKDYFPMYRAGEFG